MMKPTAVLINTAGSGSGRRGVSQGFEKRHHLRSWLDVFEDEPALKPGLAELPNAVLTPHIASAGMETRSRMVEMVVNDVLAVLEGKRPQNLVNTDIYT